MLGMAYSTAADTIAMEGLLLLLLLLQGRETTWAAPWSSLRLPTSAHTHAHMHTHNAPGRLAGPPAHAPTSGAPAAGADKAGA